MARAIPVGDATEVPLDPVDGRAPKLRALPTPAATETPFNTASDLRKMGFDMGPGNPNVGAAGSAEAQAYRAMRAAPPVAAPAQAALPARIGAGLRAVAPVLNTVGRIGSGLGVVSNFNDYKLDDPEVDSTAAGTLRAVRDGDFGMAARSAGKGLLETGMDLGSSLANTLDYVVPGKAPVSRAYNSMLHNTFGDQLIDNSGTYAALADKAGAGRGFVNPALASSGAAPTQAPAASLTAPRASFSDARFEGQNPNLRAPLTLPPGVTRTGNSYSDGSDPNGMTRMSTVPSLGADGFTQMAANIRNLPGTGEQGGMTGFTGGPTLRQIADSQNLGPSFKEQNSGRGVREERMAAARLASEQGIAGMRERGDMARAGMSMGTALRGQDINAALGREGHEVQREGQYMTARTARVQGMRDQFNKDRDFTASQQERDLKANQDSQAAFDKQLEGRFRTVDEKGNNVPDHNKIASYKTAAVSTIPALTKMLRATGTPEAMAKATELEKRGVSALTADDHDKLQQLFDTRELARASRGVGLGSSDFVDSNNLLDYVQAAGDQGVTRGASGRRLRTANGSTIDIDKLQYGPNGNTVLPNWFSAPNTNLLRGLRGLE